MVPNQDWDKLVEASFDSMRKCFLSFSFFFFFRAALVGYVGSQVGGPIGGVAVGLRHSHSNAGSESCL